MKSNLKKNDLLDLGFYGGLFIKALDGLGELVLGILLLVLSHDTINQLIRFITLPELKEDPKDFIMNYAITLGQNFSVSLQHSVAIYMLLHGITKITVVSLLWRKQLWAYPIAVSVFILLLTYEIYSYTHSPSVLLSLIILLDLVMMVIIILEYKNLRRQQL